MTRMSYKTVLKAKGIKPIRGAAHTIKNNGDVELLPVVGTHVHEIEQRDNVIQLAPALAAAMGEMA
jgi:hypothetical protein